MADDFFSDQLLECKWRDRGFPCSSFHIKISQSIVKHARADSDSVRVESTGRDAITFSARIPFRNAVARGPNETWGALYPDGHRQFLKDMSDRSAGTLQHPSLGLITVKPVSCDSYLDPGKRDGEDVTAEWIEHSENADASNAILAQESAIGGAVINAIDMDTRLSQTNFGGFDPDANVETFEESMRKIQGVFDKASLLSKQTFGIIARIQYRITNIMDAVVADANPQNWEIKNAALRLSDSLFQIKRAAKSAQKDVRFFITPGLTTLGNLAAKLANTATDLILLNPSLVASPQIQAKTIVRYYTTVA